MNIKRESRLRAGVFLNTKNKKAIRLKTESIVDFKEELKSEIFHSIKKLKSFESH